MWKEWTARMKPRSLELRHRDEGFVAELKVCSTTRNLRRGRQVHAQAREALQSGNHHVATALISMYSKCGRMPEARQVFDSIRHPDVVSWNAIISGYADNGEGSSALELLRRMRCSPTSVTYIAALKACTSLVDGSLEQGKEIHSQIGCHLNICVQSTLIYMYAKCSSIGDARQVFDSIKQPDVVAWNAMILGYADNGDGRTALDLLSGMRSQGFCRPDSRTFIAAFKACTSLALEQDESGKAECLELGKRLHSEMSNHSSTIYVENTLIDMYVKCGSMFHARQVFNRIQQPDVISWTSLIAGYAEHGEGETALELFAKMKSEGCTPNSITYVAALKACSSLGDLESGSRIHAELATSQYTANLVTCLVDFYAKCGSLVEAHKVFDAHTRTRDVTTWTALIAGYCHLGNIEAVFALFEQMQDAGIQPNAVTFLSVLTCCSHAGLVERANEFFISMTSSSRMNPNVEHYTCMLDILGRSNKLDNAIALLRGMPCRPDVVTWVTLLAACHKWKNIGIGRLAFESLLSMDYRNSTTYVLMAHIYGSRGMWQEQEVVLGMRDSLEITRGELQAHALHAHGLPVDYRSAPTKPGVLL